MRTRWLVFKNCVINLNKIVAVTHSRGSLDNYLYIQTKFHTFPIGFDSKEEAKDALKQIAEESQKGHRCAD